MPPVALTIAGSDPGGGAGIQGDLKVFHQWGVYGEAVITLVSVQNTFGVSRVEILSAELVADQIAAVIEDIPPGAIKTGALGSEEVVRAVARAAETFRAPLVVDPVMLSKNGRPLLSEKAIEALRTELLPRAALVTPNVPEAEALTRLRIRSLDDVRRAACRIRETGVRAVLIKGGHLEGPATDFLLEDAPWREFPALRLPARNLHGTGCAFSAAITAGLACGSALADAVAAAKGFIHEAIRTAAGLGHGSSPVNHHAEVR